jgi:hypothetical protein
MLCGFHSSKVACSIIKKGQTIGNINLSPSQNSFINDSSELAATHTTAIIGKLEKIPFTNSGLCLVKNFNCCTKSLLFSFVTAKTVFSNDFGTSSILNEFLKFAQYFKRVLPD